METLDERLDKVMKSLDDIANGKRTFNEDNINHPKHYELDKIECIDAMEMTQGRGAVMSFCLCNAFKYLWRHNRKNGLEDIKKAKWYLDKYIELAEKSKEEINEKFGCKNGGYCDTDDFSENKIAEMLDKYDKMKEEEE